MTAAHRAVAGEVQALVDALQLIAADGCSAFWEGPDCRSWANRSRGAKYGTYAWCDACIALDALGEPLRPTGWKHGAQ